MSSATEQAINKLTKGGTDYGLYEKRNSDGSVSNTKRVTDKVKANQHIYADIAPTLINSTNTAGYASWMKPNNNVSFGSKTFDGDAFEKARSSFMDWMTGSGSTGKYGYNLNDAEDTERLNNGQISKKYEASYSSDPFDQWLKSYGQASSQYFESKYYDKAYASVASERAQKQAVENFKKAVAQEAWSTASDPLNITGDDVAAAAQRVQLSNPQFADIEISNPKVDSDTDYSDRVSPLLAEQEAQKKDAEKRSSSLYLDDVLSTINHYRERLETVEGWNNKKAQAASAANAVNNQSVIDAAIAESGYSTEIDNRIGLAKDSTLDEWNANRQKKKAAANAVVNTMKAAGASTYEIKKAIRQDGRLSYTEDSEQGIEDEATRIQRRDSSDSIVNRILSGESSAVQESVKKAKAIGNMGTSANEGWSPISMKTGWQMSDVDTAYTEKYVNDTRLILEQSGYDGLEIDNALRRADLGEYIPIETARSNYAVYTLSEMGLSNDQIEAVLSTYDEDDWASIDKDMQVSDYVENSTVDQLGKSVLATPIRAALAIVSSVVGFADMATSGLQGRTDTWQVTDNIIETANWWTAYSHDRNHEIISEAADVGSEILRMYATSLMGTGLAAATTKAMSAAKSTNFLFNFAANNASKLPFITNSMGSYYNEAMAEGANTHDATMYAIPAGLMEGYLESLEMGQVLKNSIGANFIGKQISASGLSTTFKQFAITEGMPWINFALGVLGEGVEEGLSAIGSSLLRTATWDEEHKLDFTDVLGDAKGGMIIGAVMSGLSLPASTRSHKYAAEMYKATGGNYNAYIDSLQSAVYMESMTDTQREALIQKYTTGDNITPDVTAYAEAEAENQNLTETVAAKKKAVEAAEEDAAIKIEAAEAEVAEAEKRLASIEEANPVKKAKAVKEAARQLNGKKKNLAQIKSESQKKVETATADYQAIASKAKKTIANNKQVIEEYHAKKYQSDIEAETALNATVSDSAINPAANTNMDANTAQNSINKAYNDIVAAPETDYNKIRGDINGTAENRAAEIEAGGNAGVSGQVVAEHNPGMAQAVSELGGRTDYRGIGSSVREIIQQKEATPVDLRTATDPSSFYAAISEAKQNNPHGAFVTAHDVSEYGDMKMFLSDDNSVGVAVTKDGDIVSVFKNPNVSKARKSVSSILLTAIDNGGVKLDNYNGGLSKMYLDHGFIPVARTAFVDEYAPSDWNYERDGRPDIIFWRHNGDSVETVAQNIGTQEMPDLNALPLMEYDEAAAYRDSLIQQPPLKDLGANTPTPVEMAQSKVYTNTYDKWLNEAEKKADNTDNAWYARSKEVDTLANAKSIVEGTIRRDGNVDSVMNQLQDKIAWDATDVDTAMLIAETLRSEAAETGEYGKLNDWKNVIRQNMTQSGQAIQALAKWTRNSSIASEMALDKAVADINEKNKKRIENGKMTAVEVNPELRAELNEATTKAEREAVIEKIAADIGSKLPAGLGEKINAFRYLSMLGNPKTILRNLIGNEIMSDVLWTAKDAIGTGLENALGIEQSQRTKALAFGDRYKANKDYAASTLNDASTKLLDSTRYDTKSGIEKAINDNKQIFKTAPLELWREGTDYALNQGDVVFLEKQYKRSFAQMMTARGYTPETITPAQRNECMSYAIAEAKRSTFHDASTLADAINKIENSRKITKLLVGGALPFKKTPINVLARGVEFSPIGLVQGVSQMLTKVKSGDMSASQAIDRISSGLTGSSLMALGYFLAKSGVVTGGNNDDDKYYRSDLGYQEFALNFGDGKSITLDWAAPANIPFFMGVELSELAERNGGNDDATIGQRFDNFFNAMSGITDPLVEMSMLQGIQDTLESAANAAENDESMIWAMAKGMGTSYVSQFVPTALGQIARTIDPVRRDTRGDLTAELGAETDKVLNKMQAKVPFASRDLEPYINVWGEKEINENSWPVRLIEQTILPGYLDETDMTPVDVELVRLYSETQDSSVIPQNNPYRTLKDNDKIYVLTSSEYTEMQQDTGRAMYAAAMDAINDPQYYRLTDEEKADSVSDAIKEAQKSVLKQYKKKYLNSSK